MLALAGVADRRTRRPAPPRPGPRRSEPRPHSTQSEPEIENPVRRSRGSVRRGSHDVRCAGLFKRQQPIPSDTKVRRVRFGGTPATHPSNSSVAYGVRPLLQRGIDGRGETVVLPELAESQLSPPEVTDLRRDLVVFDHLFHLPTPRLRFVSTFSGPKDPWLAYGEEVLDAETGPRDRSARRAHDPLGQRQLTGERRSSSLGFDRRLAEGSHRRRRDLAQPSRPDRR